MTDVLFIRPADDSASVQVAAWGQVVRQRITRAAVCDLTAGEVSRSSVDSELARHPRHLFWFGHGRPDELIASNTAMIDSGNVGELVGGVVVAIACYSAVTLGWEAVARGGPASYLGFDDQFGFPANAPLPMAHAITEGLRCFYEGGHEIGCAADRLVRELDRARIEYQENGAAWGLSAGDSMTAWLFAKSNRFSLRLFGSSGTTLA
jgi:hypothetical protein